MYEYREICQEAQSCSRLLELEDQMDIALNRKLMLAL